MNTAAARPDAAPTLVERILSEDPIGAATAGRRMARIRMGKATHPATVTRWITVGIRLPGGRRLKLEGIRLNGHWVTSWPAVIRFVEAQQDVSTDDVTPDDRTPKKRNAAAEAAVAELERMGA